MFIEARSLTTGKTLWRHNRPLFEPVAAAGDAVLAVGAPLTPRGSFRIALYRASDGHQLWNVAGALLPHQRFVPKGGANEGPAGAVSRNTVVVARRTARSQLRLAAFEPSNGQRRWVIKRDAPPADRQHLAIAAKRVFWAVGDSLHVIDEKTGQTSWRWRFAYPIERLTVLAGPRPVLIVHETKRFGLYFQLAANIATQPATWAFDVEQQPPMHTRVISGSVRLGRDVPGMSMNLGGIRIMANDQSTVTDAQGRFRLEAKGRGWLVVKGDADQWVQRLNSQSQHQPSIPCPFAGYTDTRALSFQNSPKETKLTLTLILRESCLID